MNKTKWKGESKPAVPWSPFTDLAEEADAAWRKREGQKHISMPSYLLPTRSGDAQEQLWSIYDCSITSSPNKKMLDHTAFPEQSCELYSLIWGFAAAQTAVITPTSFFSLNTDCSGISTWISHREQGFPNCDTTIPCMWDTPKLLLNTVQIVDPLLPHIFFTKPNWHITKCGWARTLLLGIRDLKLFPTPTAYSRRVLFQFLFSKSFFL